MTDKNFLPEMYKEELDKFSFGEEGKEKKLTSLDFIKHQAEKDFFFFINLVSPHLQLAEAHKDLAKDMSSESHSHLLVLYPRAHLKSTITQHLAAWWLVKEPYLTIMYISGTAALSKTALGEVKRILSCEVTQTYWPDLVNPNRNKRKMWQVDQIKLDHSSREEKGIRDPSVFAFGVGSTVTGFHCDRLIYDDLVNEKNASTQEGRNKIEAAYSLGNSLLNPAGTVRAVGTYYDSTDLYHTMEGVINKRTEEKLYHVKKAVVETTGDGLGKYLWPRRKNKEGFYFGFDKDVLQTIESNYLDKKLFRSQYYNSCIDEQLKVFDKDKFRHYSPRKLAFQGNSVFYEGRKLNVYTAMDFAWTEKKSSDYTAIDTVGIDYLNFIYHLDSVRFKTSSTDIMADELLKVVTQYNPITVGLEITATQKLIIDAIINYARERGILLPKKELDPIKRGNKITYIETLKAYYDNGWIYHHPDVSSVLEEELLFLRDTSVHDDTANAFRDAVSLAIRPMDAGDEVETTTFNSRYGGVSF